MQVKKKQVVLPVLLACALCAVALPASAQSRGRGAKETMRFRGLDRNNDGIITRYEWRGNDRSFATHDWNGDGVLSGDELRPGARRPDDQFSSDWSRDRFAGLDQNGNGVIARDEWRGDSRAFDRMDANRDGVLSRDEFLARGNDRNGSGGSLSTITCSSNNGRRVYCGADTRGGVRLARQISGSPCNQGSTWGFDARGVWVDRGCRAEFELSGGSTGAQGGTIATGTSISVRTNELIDVKSSDGRVFGAVVNQDVKDASGDVAVPKGSHAELIVKNGSNQDLALDLESVTVNGQRYVVTADAQGARGGQRDGLGKNKRTATYVGGGVLLGTIIGAVAGGGKGAAIGAAAGAAAGAGAQVLTRGKAVSVPAESLLTFRLEQPLQMGAADYGVTRNGRHYHNR